MTEKSNSVARLEERLQRLEEAMEQKDKELRYYRDRMEILDCICRNARGNDRRDVDMLSDAYHEDSIDEIGTARIPGKEYADQVNQVHTQHFLQTMHNITTHLCEIDGDVAHAESYSVGLNLSADGKLGQIIAGRYIDRLERGPTGWKIALRRHTVEVMLEGDASLLNSPLFVERGYLKGVASKQDISYQRPLTLDDDAEVHRWRPLLSPMLL